MIDNVITNTLLPELSREFLKHIVRKEAVSAVRVGIEAGRFAYAFDTDGGAPADQPSEQEAII